MQENRQESFCRLAPRKAAATSFSEAKHTLQPSPVRAWPSD